MKLHQLLAILPSVKSTAGKAKTEIYQLAQKAPLFKGLSRSYESREAEGFTYPSESSVVQGNATALIRGFIEASTELFNLAATQDKTNCAAIADIEVEGVTIVANVPVTQLLFLEKQLTDIKTFIGSLPILDLDKEWTYDPNRGVYATPPRTSVKTKKVSKAVVLYEATKEHPAQVKEVNEDIVEGTWTSIDLSGGLPKDVVVSLLKKTDLLIKSVVIAREKANALDVTELRTAEPIFNFLFADVLN